MSTTAHFLRSISSFVHAKDASSLASWLVVEPPLPQEYGQLSIELKSSIPTFNDGWPSFAAFINEYLEFWRDVDFSDLLQTHTQLNALVNACITALSHPEGITILPTAINLSAALAKLAMTLDKRPDLTRRLKLSDGEQRKTLVEGTAESIQRAFTICLTERNAGIKDGRPEGKKIGIYKFANLVLKLLFQCRKTRLANQLFTNISQHSPPLHLYPASQRVTYLYYLGRFFFANTHYFRSQLCLQEAYNQCHAKCIRQRRLILIYLISANLILGRFPSRAFFARPESAGILEKFAPIARAIRRGDLATFKHSMDEQWFFKRGLFLSILHRAEMLVWRSLARRTFLLTFHFPFDPESRKAPTLDLNDLVVAAVYCQRLLEGYQRPKIDSFNPTGKPAELIPPTSGPKTLAPHEGTVYGNREPDLLEIEAIVASLVQQGLLHGFISHNLSRFAILGSKQRGGPLKAGFPPPWQVIRARAESGGSDVPGWVRQERKALMGGVVNLSGIARPVGSGVGA